MNEQRPTAPEHALTDSQKTRVEFARQDWEDARSTDLAGLNAASLILVVERLRRRLGDVLDLLDEVTSE